MAKVTEITPKVERSFTLEVSEDELQVLKALLNNTTVTSPHTEHLWKVIDGAIPNQIRYNIVHIGAAGSTLCKVIRIG